jgi:hypothetical protein
MSSTSLPSLPPLSPPPSATTTSPHPPRIPSAQRTAEARDAFTASLTNVGASLSAELTSRARTIHENNRALEAQEKKLKQSTKALAKETDALEKFLRKSDKGGKGALSEFDDLDGLLGGLEGELDFLDGVLEEVEGEIGVQEGESEGDGGLGEGDLREGHGVNGERDGKAMGDEIGGTHMARNGVEERLESLHVSDIAKGKQPAV